MNKYVGVKKENVYYSSALRSFLLSVYNYMFLALAITGIVSYGVSSSDYLIGAIYGTPLSWVVAFAPIIFVFFISSRINSMTLGSAQICLGIFSVLMGLSLSFIFLVYTGSSIVRVFFISAAMFGAMALYGNNTNRDLSSLGSLLYMGVFGLIVASLVNLFMQSSVLQFAVSFLGVIIFCGLTAYDMQKIKQLYYSLADSESVSQNGSVSIFVSKVAVLGALTLYLDFINMFTHLLHLMGDRK